MTLLLDTHAFLWFCQGDPAFSPTAKALLENANNRKLVSMASCWEIAIKAGLPVPKKLVLGEPGSVYLPAALARTGFELLFITLEHATRVESLPPHHKDPFDRLFVAQTMVEGVCIVSIDSQLDPYPITRLW